MAKFAVIVAPPAKEGESAEYRSYRAPKAPWTTPRGMENVSTVHEFIEAGVAKWANHPFLGQRRYINTHTEQKEVTKKIDGEDKKVKKDWTYYELGPYEWETFREYNAKKKKIASGLAHLGVTPGKKRFHMYAKTCKEWMEIATACVSQSITIVTAYDTLGIEGLRASINQTGTHGILLDRDNLPNLRKVLNDAPSIKLVVYRDSEGDLSDKEKQSIEEFKTYNDGITVVSFSELIDIGEKHMIEPLPPKNDDVCCIMYTSGSTGPPKGVVLTHRNVLGGITGAAGNIDRVVGPGDVFLSILPLAHILEFTAELTSFWWGSALGYGNPKTITDTNMRNSKGDIRELRPTVIVAVPAVFEAIKKGIVAKVSKMSGVTQKVFWGAFKLKQTMRSWHLPVPLVDSLIFKNISEATGGRLRYLMNGGAPVSHSTRAFINTLLAPLIMGYGLTETNAMCALSDPKALDMDSTGELVPSITIKLVDVPDAGYFSKNDQGEIWVKGPAVSPGYYKNKEETKEAYTSDGWFKTGDIAELSPVGKIRIVDRKKNLVKTLNGEYVALERLEALYRSNKYVSNLCVFATSEHAKPVAVVVPLESAMADLASSMGTTWSDHLVFDKRFINAVLKSLNETAKENDFRPVEWLADIYMTDDEWTPQSGFVTSAQKLQRKKIAEAYKDGIANAFKNA